MQAQKYKRKHIKWEYNNYKKESSEEHLFKGISDANFI